jgi:PadR family transcriptional regulator AphA
MSRAGFGRAVALQSGRGAVMPRRQGPGLSLAEWLVLCLVSEEPTHCFALAALLAPDGSVGMAWHVRKAVVYRAAERLQRLGLITAADKQATSQGPPRIRLQATPVGHRAAQGWLRQPAAHTRDVRSELLLKLALLSRAGADPRDLLRAQRRQLVPVAEGLAGQMRTATGSGQALTRWRHESVCATLRFLDTLLAAAPAPRAETAHATAAHG